MSKQSRIKTLQNRYPDLPLPILIKNEILFHGISYTHELGKAGEWAIPNYQPYRFKEGEEDPTGRGYIDIPYLMTLSDGSLVRILGNSKSPYRIVSSRDRYLLMEGDEEITEINLQKRPLWQKKRTGDGTPMSSAGVSQHGDMLIINPTPGCEYFLYREKERGESYRCKFCHYGVPDKRSKRLGQAIGKGRIDRVSLTRIMEVCKEAGVEANHFYLVGGSMVDIKEEGERYIQLAEAIQEVTGGNLPVCCGSSSLREDALLRLYDAGVRGVCFNLEVWDRDIWKEVCPGKERFVGYEQWIKGLLDAVRIFGDGRVMSAFVTGVEFTTEKGFQNMKDAMESCLQGTEWLLQHGILPLYSVQWPPAAPSTEDDPLGFIQDYFLKLNIQEFKLRKRYNLTFPNEFVCHRCTYMQLECDFDHYWDI